MSHTNELRANAEAMFRLAEAAELPAVRDKLMNAGRASLDMAERLERARERGPRALQAAAKL